MTPEEMRQRLRKRPFEPFRVFLTDGRVLDVLYPDMHLVLTKYVSIGIPEPNVPDPFADHWVDVPYEYIQRTEPLPAPSSQPSA